jgi:CheY-like chemotaxis protein
VNLGDSGPGKGSTFTIRIHYTPMRPMEAEIEKTTKKSIEMPAVLKDKKILIIEDSVDNQLLAQLYLTRSGASVEFADNGQSGVEKALGHSYDAVLMDIQMPVMDGYSATRELRKQGFHTPIIALTGCVMKEDQQRCFDAGCDDYLAKPFDRKSLIECVAKHV